MNKKDYKLYVKLVQDRYERLHLSFEQAEKIFLFEQDKDMLPIGDSSFWEEMYFEMDFFQSVLTSKQLAIYEQEWEHRNQEHVHHLIETDKNALVNINLHQPILAYQQEKLLPILSRSGIKSILLYDREMRRKVEYVKKEYKHFWQAEKRNIYIKHYRHFRLYQPHTLKSQLLHHETYRILPDLKSFRSKADAPTKAMLDFIKEHIKKGIKGYKRMYQQDLQKTMTAYTKFFYTTMNERFQQKLGGKDVIRNEAVKDITDKELITVLLLMILMDDEPAI